MVKIQIIFLFTASSTLSPSQKNQLQEIAAEEYCKEFKRGRSQIQTEIHDGYSQSSKYDIVLAISGGDRVINEGLLMGRARDAIARRYMNLPYLQQRNFSGKIGTQQKEVPVEKKDAPAPDASPAGNGPTDPPTNQNDYRERAKAYTATEPRYNYNLLQIPASVMAEIDQALGRIQYEREVFDEWGLREIMPSPVSAMSFYGPPGTGKSMAAEAIASKLGKKIILASYADIENKYVGEGPKNVGAIFLAAEQQDAVLFIDEADSLLSKRLVNVSDPSGQAMNSMRSQLLICLERFHGIVIFATNLAVNYDRAFVSRLINIKFELPDATLREKIWRVHLMPQDPKISKLRVPLHFDVDLKALAEAYPLCGREIRNAVVDACVYARMNGYDYVTQHILMQAAAGVQRRSQEAANAEDHTAVAKPREIAISRDAKELLAKSMERQFKENQDNS